MATRRPYEKINPLFRTLDSWINISSRIFGTTLAEFVGEKLALDPLRSWFYSAINAQHEFFSGKLTYFEFGVGGGGTLLRYISALKSFCRKNRDDIYNHHIYLFDSFMGLPAKKDIRDDHPHWGKGVFYHPREEIEGLLKRHGIEVDKGTVHFVEGYFEQTLTPKLATEIPHKPTIITIDVDYYSSTMTVLRWLRPLLREGTLFYFDDVWSFYGNPYKGELAAINDFNGERKGLLVPYWGKGHPRIWPNIYAYVAIPRSPGTG